MPSTRDIQQHFGFASQTAAMSHLRALERKGAIRRLPGKARAVAFPEDINRVETVVIPVLGTIASSQNAEIPDSPHGRLTLDINSLGVARGTKPFAFRARGDAMEGAHICDGDCVILVSREAKENDIVAAHINGETCLRRYVIEHGHPYVKAENPRYPDLTPAHDLLIQGVMVGLYRGQSSAAVPVES